MVRTSLFSSMIAVGLAAAMSLFTSTPTRADTWDRLTFLTFSGTVQVPGATLNAGTYRFHITNPSTAANVIQVLSKNGRTVYAMFNTIPDTRMTVTQESTVTFRETPAGVPPAIKSLFYGGEHDGYEFVYPKGEPIETAQVVETPQPPITVAPVQTAQVSQSESTPGPAPEVAQAAPTTPPTELPKTASPVPLVAFGGFVALIMGLGTGLLRKVLG